MSPLRGRTVGKPRRGATCDARCRHGTVESAANGIPLANGKSWHPPAPANPAALRPSSARHPGDMNVAPTVADCGRPVGAPLVTPGAGTAQWNPPQTESAANESAANESAANGIRRKRIRRKRNSAANGIRPPQESRPGRWLCISVNKRLPLQACREKQISLSDERYGISTSLHAAQPF